MAKFVYLLCAAFIAAIFQEASSLSIQPLAIGDEDPSNELVLDPADLPIVNMMSIADLFYSIDTLLECSAVGLYRSYYKAMGTAITKLNDSFVDYYHRILKALSQCPKEMGFFKCIKQSILEIVADSGRLVEDFVDSVDDFATAFKTMGHEIDDCINEHNRHK